MEAASSLASSALLQQGIAQSGPGPRLAALPLLQLPAAVVQEVLSCLPADGKGACGWSARMPWRSWTLV